MKLYKGKIYELVCDYSITVQSTDTPVNLEIPMLGRIINNVLQFNFVKVRTNWFGYAYQQFRILSLILTRSDGTSTSVLYGSITFMVPYDVEINDSDIALTSGAITINEIALSDFTMMFIHSNAEDNRVDKQLYLQDGEIQTGTLRESSSIINPRITFQYSTVPSFNYVYIPSFNRFYFVNGFTFISKNLWVMELNVDVLMSFNNEIRTQTAYIDRQENIYDDELVDDEIDTHFAKGIYHQVISPTTQIFPVTQTEEDTRECYLLTVVKV